jgi:phosphoglucomutase
MIAETAAWAVAQGKSFFDILLDMYCTYGFYLEKLHSLTIKGKSGAEKIAEIMQNFRNSPPVSIAGSKVIAIKDYALQKEFDLLKKQEKPIELPRSNVLQFFLEDGSKITARPSGTEPKIKFYFGVKGTLSNKNEFDRMNTEMEKRIRHIIEDMKLE